MKTITLEDLIRELWNECRNILYIAQKLNLTDENGEYDTGYVETVVYQ